MKSPFALTSVLLCLHGPNLHDALHAADRPPTPALDLIASQGITTAISLTPSEQNLPTLTPHLVHLARTHAQRDTHLVRCLQPNDAPPGRGVHFVDAADDLAHADELAAQFMAVLSETRTHDTTRSSNRTPNATAVGMVGVLLTGPGDWAAMLPSPVKHLDDLLPLPPQTWQCSDASSQSAVRGLACWSGCGLVRTDARKSIAERCAPGEGRLDLLHLVEEMLSKTGLVERYGA